MAMASTKFTVEAQDKTAGAFNSIGKRAQAASSKLSSMFGGALAAAGAYLSFRGIASAISSLSQLSDVAVKAGTSVEDLTSLSGSLGILGIAGASVESLGKAFAYMQKTTGRQGMEGFRQALADIQSIEDPAERAKAAMEVFGRSGQEFLPIINGSARSIESLTNLQKAYPRVSQAAADAGDETWDAMTTVGNGVVTIWKNAIGAICADFNSNFEGDIRGAALRLVADMELYAKMIWLSFSTAWKRITGEFEAAGTFIGTFFGEFFQGGGIKGAFNSAVEAFSAERKMLNNEMDALDEQNKKRIDAWTKRRDEVYEASRKIDYDLGKGVRDRLGSDAAARRSNINNKLVIGGSNDAIKMMTIGPNLQSETKKQTALQEVIAKNGQETNNLLKARESAEVYE